MVSKVNNPKAKPGKTKPNPSKHFTTNKKSINYFRFYQIIIKRSKSYVKNFYRKSKDPCINEKYD